jgi:hypothetical protein
MRVESLLLCCATQQHNNKPSIEPQPIHQKSTKTTFQDPYFNEPSNEVMRGKAEGTSSSTHYNAEVRLATLRWAMLAHLKRPPPGFEDVIQRHFR